MANLLRYEHRYIDRDDPAAIWAVGHEFKLRRAWWRRVRFAPALIAGYRAFNEALLDLSAMFRGPVEQ